MFDLRAAGDWLPHQVAVAWTRSTRRIVPEVERAIDEAWAAAAGRLVRIARPDIGVVTRSACKRGHVYISRVTTICGGYELD